MFQDYFGVCTEAAIKDNVVVVYELLEEMLDNGFPLATESNILKELIKPPTILRTMVNTITGPLHTSSTLAQSAVTIRVQTDLGSHRDKKFRIHTKLNSAYLPCMPKFETLCDLLALKVYIGVDS